MKITKFIAKNFAGIYAGTGKTKIEIDFTDNKNIIILLLGMNGSGKTTLLSILHPFRETYDTRKNFILEGKEGYKEITIQDKDDIYIIKHYYSKSSNKNKAYISKNNIELNENGGINTFMDIMKDKFNLTKEYFTIGKIGSNVQGFIGKSTAERKSYINQFVPNIDEYLDAYDVVNEKWKTYNKDIKSLKSSIEKIDENALLMRKTDIETELKSLQVNNKELEKEITLLTKETEDFKLKTKDVDPDIEEKVNGYLETAELSDRKLEAYILKYPKLEEYNLDSINDKLNENNINLVKVEEEIKNLDSTINNLNESISNQNSTFQKNENLITVLKTNFIDPSETKTSIINKKLELSNVKKKNSVARTKLEEVNENLLSLDLPPTDIKHEIDNFFSNIHNIKSLYTLDVVENAKVEELHSLLDLVKKLNSKIQEDEIELDDIKKKIYYLDTNVTKYQNTLVLKPSDCNNTTCSFIREAANFMNNEYTQLNEYLEKRSELENRINENGQKVEYYTSRINFLNDIKKYLLDNFDNLLFMKYLLTLEDIYEVIQSDTLVKEKTDEVYENYSTLFNTDKLIIELTKDIEREEKVLNENTEKEKVINGYITENQNIGQEIERKKTEVVLNEDTKKSKISLQISHSNTIKLFTIVKNLILDSENNWNLFDEYNKIFEDNKIMLEGIINNTNKIELNNKEINKNENLINLKTNEIDSIKNKLFLFKTYSDKLRQIENEIQDIEIIKDALDPKKGIPLIFMNNYLNIISATANELLDKAYGGDFKIAFKVTSRDFMINVFKADGTMLNDITEASQGEVSLTTIALSLAMMQNLLANCKYNILYLDEVDATLSTANRRIFLELLQVQLKDIDQCFVISHNDEFYSQPIDMILMKDNNIDQTDSDLMENKNVLFDINRIKTSN